MKKKVLGILLTAALAVTMLPLHVMADDTYVLQVGSSNSAGAFFQFSTAMSTLVDGDGDSFKAVPVATNGSNESFSMMQANQVQAGSASATNLMLMMAGEADFEGRPVEGVQVWTSISPEYWQVLAPANSEAETLEDLKGKKVSFSVQGTGYYSCNMLFFRTVGIDPEEYFDAVYLSPSDSIDALASGQIDALMMLNGSWATATQVAESASGLKLITIPQEWLDKIKEAYPFTVDYTLPAGTMTGVDYDYPTAADNMGLFSLESTEVPEDVVYEYLKTMYDHIDEIRAVNPIYEYITPENTVRDWWGVLPFHPGAEKYYREIGAITD